ncbi:hypothetical protein ACTFIT_004932 [Dictyostelium discoideum]
MQISSVLTPTTGGDVIMSCDFQIFIILAQVLQFELVLQFVMILISQSSLFSRIFTICDWWGSSYLNGNFSNVNDLSLTKGLNSDYNSEEEEEEEEEEKQQDEDSSSEESR